MATPPTAVAADEVQTSPAQDQMKAGGLVVVEDEFPVARPPPRGMDGTHRSGSPAGHRLWWRDPIVVFGWFLPLFGLIAFFGYEFVHRRNVGREKIATLGLEAVAKEDQWPRTLNSEDETGEEGPAESPEEPGAPPPPSVQKNEAAKAAGQDGPKAPPPADKPPPAHEGNPAQAGEETFDLRGPSPKIGFKVRERTNITGTRTNTFARPRRRTISVKTELAHNAERLYTVADTLDVEVCEYQTKLITGDVTVTVVDLAGRRRRSEQLEELVGEVIRSRKVDGKWTHTLVGRTITDREQAALSRLILWFEDREFFPVKEQRLGATWDVDCERIDRLLRTDMISVSGKVEAQFVQLIKHDGELCAAIRYRGTVRGRVEFGEGKETNGTLFLGIMVYRSLANGVDVKTEGQINLRSSDTAMINKDRYDVSTSGRIAISSTARVEK